MKKSVKKSTAVPRLTSHEDWILSYEAAYDNEAYNVKPILIVVSPSVTAGVVVIYMTAIIYLPSMTEADTNFVVRGSGKVPLAYGSGLTLEVKNSCAIWTLSSSLKECFSELFVEFTKRSEK